MITKMDKVLKISRRGFLIGQKSSSSLIGRRSCSSGIGGDGVNEVLEAAEGEALTPSENRVSGPIGVTAVQGASLETKNSCPRE